MKFLEVFIDSIIMWSAAYIVGKTLFEEKINITKVIINIMIFSFALGFLNILNLEGFSGVLKIICVYSLQCLFYKLTFKKSLSKSTVVALILYLCLCTSEVILGLSASIISEIIKQPVAILKNTILINVLVSVVEILIVHAIKQKLIYIIKQSNINEKINIAIIAIILITLALLGFKIPINNWKLNTEFIITMFILFAFCLIGLLTLKQKSDIQKTTSMYQQLANYSNITNKLLEDYRIVSHEHKNQLSIIRGMVDDSNKELIEYIDSLLNKRSIIKYQWVTQLNNLPIPGLKGLFNYKLVEMESEKINISIYISKDIMKTNLKTLNEKQKDELYSIIGVYLDNAIEAAKETKKKEVSIEIFKDQKDIIITIANTYKNDINLNKVDEYGYTTKGKNHGVGLHIVKKILEENNLFSQERKIYENYYVQSLKIYLSKINNKKNKKPSKNL